MMNILQYIFAYNYSIQLLGTSDGDYLNSLNPQLTFILQQNLEYIH